MLQKGTELVSDVDEQLLLCISFLGTQKLHSLQLTSTPDGTFFLYCFLTLDSIITGRAPKTIKFYVNSPTMDFSNANDSSKRPAHTVVLTPKDYNLQEDSEPSSKKSKSSESTEKLESKDQQLKSKEVENQTLESKEVETNSEKTVNEVNSRVDSEEHATIPLPLVKFQNVSSVTIFVENNMGNKDTSCISSLKIFGTPSKRVTKVDQVIE
jgi:hypothetical protein